MKKYYKVEYRKYNKYREDEYYTLQMICQTEEYADQLAREINKLDFRACATFYECVSVDELVTPENRARIALGLFHPIK